MSGWTADGQPRPSLLRSAYASGELTPEALIECVYARMERDDRPGVWIHASPARKKRCARARRARRLCATDLPLYGVPFAVKDNIDVAGLPTTAALSGVRLRARRSRAAVGGRAACAPARCCLGKINLDQFATGLVGTRSPYGACQQRVRPSVPLRRLELGLGASRWPRTTCRFALGTDTAGSGACPRRSTTSSASSPRAASSPPRRGAGLRQPRLRRPCSRVTSRTRRASASVMLGRPAGPRSPRRRRASRFAVPARAGVLRRRATSSARVRARGRAAVRAGRRRRVVIDYAPFASSATCCTDRSWSSACSAWARSSSAPGRRAADHARHHPGRQEVVSAATRSWRFQRLRACCAQRAWPRSRAVRLHASCPRFPRHFTPRGRSARPAPPTTSSGIYTRFVNFLGCPVLAVPADFRGDGLPYGIRCWPCPART